MKWLTNLRRWAVAKLDPDWVAAHKEALAAEAEATTSRAAMDMLEDVECPFCGRPVPLDHNHMVIHEYMDDKLGRWRTCPCSGFTVNDADIIAHEAEQPHPGQVAP